MIRNVDGPKMKVEGMLVDGSGHHEESHHLVHVVPHDVVEKLIEEWLKEHYLEVWIDLVSWSVYVGDVDDWLVLLFVDFVEWTMGVCPDRNGAGENVTESGDEAVEVVVAQGQVEDVELAWVAWVSVLE